MLTNYPRIYRCEIHINRLSVTVIEFIDGIVHVIHSKQFEKWDIEAMVSHASSLIRQYNLNNGNNKVFVHGSQPGFIRTLKIAIREYPNYEVSVEKSKRGKIPLYKLMNIVPVSSGERHRHVLGNIKKWMDMGRIAIDPDVYPELMTDLRIATADGGMSLRKTECNMDFIPFEHGVDLLLILIFGWLLVGQLLPLVGQLDSNTIYVLCIILFSYTIDFIVISVFIRSNVAKRDRKKGDYKGFF